MGKIRLDIAVVERGLTPSRERAKALILAGKILVNGQVSAKVGTLIRSEDLLILRGPDIPYVSRGGVKLAGALDALAVTVAGCVYLDIGASTGGFTDCLLQRGALRVYAIDVGHGQLDWNLRNDPRVINLEKVNARHLDQLPLPELADGAVIDVSFISLGSILPSLRTKLMVQATVVALVKPQFEVGPKALGRTGVVNDPAIRAAAIESMKIKALALGYKLEGDSESCLPGAKGNREHFLLLRNAAPALGASESSC